MITQPSTFSAPIDLEPLVEQQEPWIEGRLIANLMATAWETQLTLVVLIPVMFLIMHGEVWSPGLYMWAAAASAIAGYRLRFMHIHRRTLHNAPTLDQLAFIRRYGFTWPLSAVIWGGSSALHFDKAGQSTQFLCWLVLVGTSTFAVTNFASQLQIMRSYLNALAITLLVVIAWHIAVDQSFRAPLVQYLMLLMVIAYWWLLLQSGRRLHESLRGSVQLQHANAELIRSLKQQTRTALEAVQTKNRFIASAAHDLRQPVHALSLYADWLRSEPELASELTPKIVQSTKAVNELFDALFDLVRLDAGKIKPQWQEVPLDALVRELAVQYMPQAESKGVEIRLRTSPVIAWSDPIMLRRILGNLLSNAVRHTASGGVLLAVRTHGSGIRIEVWDTGSGIAPEHQQMIFREFFRVPIHQGTEEGFGLGLSIVSRLAVALGHPLGLQSQPGRGSVFRLTVPLARYETETPGDSGFEQPGGPRQM